MALSNFSELKTAITDWLERPNLSTKTEDFIRLAENRIYRELRIPPMEVKTTLSIVNGNLISIPDDLLELKTMYYSKNNKTVTLQSAPLEKVLREADTTGDPLFFNRIASQWVLGPTPSDSSTITPNVYYYRELEALSSTNTDNWFTDYAPGLLLFASLVEASKYDKDLELEAFYERKYLDVRNDVIKLVTDSDYSSSPIQVISDIKVDNLM